MTKFQVGDVVSVQGVVTSVVPDVAIVNGQYCTVELVKGVNLECYGSLLQLVKPRPFKAGELAKYVDPITRQLLPATILAIYGERVWVLNENKTDKLVYLSDLRRIDE